MELPLDMTLDNTAAVSVPATPASLPRRTTRGWACLAAYAALAALIGGLYAFGVARGVPFADLSRDPLAVSGGKPYFGMLSNLGILLWCAAASVCLFTAALQSPTRRSAMRHFFLASGMLTMLLLIDDLCLLHDEVLPEIFGIRQRYTILLYLVITAYYLMYYFKYLSSHYPLLILAALSLFTISVGVDTIPILPEHVQHLVEDGAKLFGILAWCHYFVRVCREEIVQCANR